MISSLRLTVSGRCLCIVLIRVRSLCVVLMCTALVSRVTLSYLWILLSGLEGSVRIMVRRVLSTFVSVVVWLIVRCDLGDRLAVVRTELTGWALSTWTSWSCCGSGL